MYKFFIALPILLLFNKYAISQKGDVQIGYSYLEHFSVGIGLNIKENHKISALFGSNLFVNMSKFAVYQMQYEYPNQFKRKYLLNFGLKGGYSIYSNRYYKWDLLSIAPISNVKYRIKDKVVLALTIGATFSKVLEQKRLESGEIGWYRELLPEFKISLSYGF